MMIIVMNLILLVPVLWYVVTVDVVYISQICSIVEIFYFSRVGPPEPSAYSAYLVLIATMMLWGVDMLREREGTGYLGVSRTRHLDSVAFLELWLE